jgi:hypothetical protein
VTWRCCTQELEDVVKRAGEAVKRAREVIKRAGEAEVGAGGWKARRRDCKVSR